MAKTTEKTDHNAQIGNIAQSALELKALYAHLNDELMQSVLKRDEHEDEAALVSLCFRLITKLSNDIDQLYINPKRPL